VISSMTIRHRRPTVCSSTSGSLLALGRMLLYQPERDEAHTVDGMAADVFRALGHQSYDVGLHSVVDPQAQLSVRT
jgi:hypothetical protein